MEYVSLPYYKEIASDNSPYFLGLIDQLQYLQEIK
jgi:hypothetical protein